VLSHNEECRSGQTEVTGPEGGSKDCVIIT
jgi:hypothetical protein